MKTAQDWIRDLGLQAHPEGGFYRETYRSQQQLGPGPVSTAIYFLLRTQDISAFHRITSDEVWHWYAASPHTQLRVWRLTPSGERRSFVLGNEPSHGQVFQDWVPAGDWFASEIEVLPGGDEASAYALVGCTVSPGFLFSNFELADREILAARYPEHAALVRRLTLQSS